MSIKYKENWLKFTGMLVVSIIIWYILIALVASQGASPDSRQEAIVGSIYYYLFPFLIVFLPSMVIAFKSTKAAFITSTLISIALLAGFSGLALVANLIPAIIMISYIKKNYKEIK
ncbi:MAG: hypothetical protein WDZ40_00865 [Candidatus Spechtbacterales bacterium]